MLLTSPPQVCCVAGPRCAWGVAGAGQVEGRKSRLFVAPVSLAVDVDVEMTMPVVVMDVGMLVIEGGYVPLARVSLPMRLLADLPVLQVRDVPVVVPVPLPTVLVWPLLPVYETALAQC